jgi:hypothetical protein
LQSSQLMRSRKVDLGLTFQRYLDYSVQGLPHRCCRNGVLSGREFRKEPGTVRDSFEDFFPVDVFNQDISSAEMRPFGKACTVRLLEFFTSLSQAIKTREKQAASTSASSSKGLQHRHRTGGRRSTVPCVSLRACT